jgi:hypothetical protein
MRFTVQSTHAVPREGTALFLVKTTTLLLCPRCHQPLGSYMSERERAILEACHDCEAHALHSGPVASEPFN